MVNAGSVGSTSEGDAAAFWALLEGDDVQLWRTAVDIRRQPAEELRATGAPDDRRS